MDTKANRWSYWVLVPTLLSWIFGGAPAAHAIQQSNVELQSIDFLAGCTDLGCGGEFSGLTGNTVQNNNIVGGSPLNVFCIDYQNDVYIPGSPYQADFSTITTGSDLSDTRFGRTESQWDSSSQPMEPIDFSTTSFFTGSVSFDPTQLQRYQMVAWLTQQYNLPGASNDAIQSAIWQVTDNTPPPQDGPGQPYDAIPVITGSAQWLEQAAAFVSANTNNNGYWSQFRVVTNIAPLYMVGQNPAQEFITVVPEPVFPALLAASILGFVLYRKRRRLSRN